MRRLLHRLFCIDMGVCSIEGCKGMRGTAPRPYAANVAPAPLLSFSCVKKKEGGERKSLRELFGGGRPTLCLAATPVSLRASISRKGNRNF